MGQCCVLCGRLAVYFDPFPTCAPCYTPAPVTVPTVGEMLEPLPAFGWLAGVDVPGLVERLERLEQIIEERTGEL